MRPFDDVRHLATLMEPADAEAVARAGEQLRAGRRDGRDGGALDALALFLAGWRGTVDAEPKRPNLVLFAASNALSEALDVSARTRASEAAGAISGGAAPVTAVCGAHELGLKVFDLALAMPSPDISAEAAMEESACAATIAFGMEALADGPDLLGLDIVAPGGEVPALALLAAMDGLREAALAAATERHGAGARARIETALALHADHLADPLEALRCLGGRDVSALVGAILAARLQQVPVVIGGVVALAAAAIASALRADALEHVRLADAGDEFERGLATRLNLGAPILGFGSRLDDGISVAMAMGTLRAAAAMLAKTRPAA
ncbi:MAG: nicotinate-nucleotide--dimethylbenzimidazole phosphoribosyltransferase [Hyphomicrobiaceae bacterium]|nr:nicotinate-nucleotide--dimethylbenzimidazole phosphoribosyltransferase [Hyphomicrobiaceae bacterium]